METASHHWKKLHCSSRGLVHAKKSRPLLGSSCRSRTSVWATHSNRGDVAKKGGGREAMASVELRWRLGWYGWGGPCCGGGGGERVCQFYSIKNPLTLFLRLAEGRPQMHTTVSSSSPCAGGTRFCWAGRGNFIVTFFLCSGSMIFWTRSGSRFPNLNYETGSGFGSGSFPSLFVFDGLKIEN